VNECKPWFQPEAPYHATNLFQWATAAVCLALASAAAKTQSVEFVCVVSGAAGIAGMSMPGATAHQVPMLGGGDCGGVGGGGRGGGDGGGGDGGGSLGVAA